MTLQKENICLIYTVQETGVLSDNKLTQVHNNHLQVMQN